MLHDSAALRTAFDQLGEQYIDFVRSISNEALTMPGLDDWTVRELLGHALRAFSTAAQYLDATPASNFRMHTAGEYYRTAFASNPMIHAEVAERGRQAGAALGSADAGIAEIAEIVEVTIRAACARVGAADDDADVNTFVGQIRLMPYLSTRIVEAGVHLLDLQRAVGARVGLDAVSAQIIVLTLTETGDVTQVILMLTGRSDVPSGFNVLR
jgi:hypothetical protein